MAFPSVTIRLRHLHRAHMLAFGKGHFTALRERRDSFLLKSTIHEDAAFCSRVPQE